MPTPVSPPFGLKQLKALASPAFHTKQGGLDFLHGFQMRQAAPLTQRFHHTRLLHLLPLMQHHHPERLLLALTTLDQVEVTHLENLQTQPAIGKQAARQREQLEVSQLWLRRPSQWDPSG